MLPDGRIITASGRGYGGRGRVLVWDPGPRRRRPDRVGPYRDKVTAIAVLPDGRIIVSVDGWLWIAGDGSRRSCPEQ